MKTLPRILSVLFLAGALASTAMAGPKEEAALRDRVEALEAVNATQKKQLADLREERDTLKAKVATHEATIAELKKPAAAAAVAKDAPKDAPKDTAKDAAAKDAAHDAYYDRTETTKGQPILTGPRGGRYHISDSGKKVYEKHTK